MRHSLIRVLRAGAVALLVGPGCQAAPLGTAPRSPFVAADSLRDERRFVQAHPEYRRLRDSFALAQDSAGWWRAQLWWAQTLMRLARTDSSETAIQDAFGLAGADSSRHAWTYLMRCGLWSRLGRPEPALADCGRAQGLAERLGDGELRARVHFQLGTIYSRRGLFRRSVQETERAVALERRYGRSPHQLAGVLNSVGVEYAAVGRLTEAAAAYEEGLAITRRVSDTSTGGYLISNLAALRSYTGRLDQAVDLMTQSLGSAQAMGDTASMVYAHNALAEYLLRAGNLAGARLRVERSLALSRGSPAIYRVIALIDLGLIAMAEGHPDSAAATFERALPLAVSGGFAFERFRILAAQVRLAVGRNHPIAARRLVTVAKTVADSLGAPEAELDLLALLGSVAELERRPDASRFFLEGIALLESWRGRLSLGDLRLGMAEPKWNVYEGAIRTLMDGGQAAAALAVAERARARMLLEVMAERTAAREAAPEAAVKQRLRQRFEEAGAGGDSSQQRRVRAELAALQDSLAQLEDPPGTRDPRASIRHPAPAPLAELRAQLLGSPGTALLSVFWGDSAVYGWWVTGTDLRGRRLGRADSLAATVEFLRRTIERPGDAEWQPAAARAYQQILGPLDPGGAVTILAIVDGPLTRLPLEVLLPAAGASPLGATHRIVYGPSASVLATLVRTRPVGNWQRSLLAVGNPRGARASTAAGSTAGQAARGQELALPYAEAEARTLHDVYRRTGGDLLVGRAATLGRWLALNPGRYRYLHFAAHARVNDREPDQSHLMLADGRLDPPAIRRLELSAELVTLSACETALGRQVRGEGVVGLSHAFLSAGARSTLVTLWPVTDRSTLRFMTDLYAELHGGQLPAAALQSVRRRWIQSEGATSHPAYWAPFILLGDPSLPPL